MNNAMLGIICFLVVLVIGLGIQDLQRRQPRGLNFAARAATNDCSFPMGGVQWKYRAIQAMEVQVESPVIAPRRSRSCTAQAGWTIQETPAGMQLECWVGGTPSNMLGQQVHSGWIATNVPAGRN